MVAGRRKEDCVFRLPALYTGVYFMNQEKKTEKSDLLFLVLITILAVAVRLAVRTFVAEDWSVYWSDWLARLSEGGIQGTGR